MDYLVFNSTKLPVKIAITDEEQARGLMWEMQPNPMAFPSELRPKKFWMANCPVPLDMIFCAEGKVIDIVRGQPYSINSVGPEQASDLVIEVAGGRAEELGIKIGTAVQLHYSLISAAKSQERFLQLLQ